VDQALLAGADRAAADEDPAAVFALEADAVFAGVGAAQAGAGGAVGAVVISKGDGEGRVAVVRPGSLGRGGAGALDEVGAGAVHPQRPLRDVVVVRAPVGHLAAGVFVPPAEVVMAA